jgi:hypothetical protein
MMRTHVRWLTLAMGAALAGCVAEPAAPPARREVAASRTKPARDGAVEPIRPVERQADAPPVHGRDPFAFGMTPAMRLDPKTLPPLPPPEGLPELQLPMVGPPVRLIGIITGRERPPVRTAVLSVGADLVLAHVGDAVAVRYKVEAISDDGVSLVDAAAEEHVRLPLK